MQNHTRGITCTRNFCKFCTPVDQYPGYGYAPVKVPECGYGYIIVPTRNFCEFCTSFMPVPGTFVSYIRLPYPYPEFTNPTEHNLKKLRHTQSKNKPVNFIPR